MTPTTSARAWRWAPSSSPYPPGRLPDTFLIGRQSDSRLWTDNLAKHGIDFFHAQLLWEDDGRRARTSEEVLYEGP